MDRVELYGYWAGNHRLTERVQSLTKRLHDKNESVTKLQKQVEGEADWHEYWKEGYFEVYGELQEQIKEDWFTESQGLVKRIQSLETRLSERDHRITDLLTEVESLQFAIKAIETHRDDWFVKYRKLESSFEFCKNTFAELIAQAERDSKWYERYKMVRSKEKVLQKMLDAKTDQLKAYAVKNEKLIRETMKAPANDAHDWQKLMNRIAEDSDKLNDLGAALEAERARSAFFEKLLGALYGDSWDKLTVASAQTYRTKEIQDRAFLETKVKSLEGYVLLAQEGHDHLVRDLDYWRDRSDKSEVACQTLEAENKSFKAKVKRLEEEAVLIQGGYDCLVEELDQLRAEREYENSSKKKETD